MIKLKKSFFQLLDSFLGEVYFRVAKHYGIGILEVMNRFFSHDLEIMLLMRKYGEEVKNEQKRAKEIKEEARKNRLRRKLRR